MPYSNYINCKNVTRELVDRIIQVELTDAQRAYMLEYLSGSTQEEISTKHSVSQSTVSRSLTSSTSIINNRLSYVDLFMHHLLSGDPLEYKNFTLSIDVIGMSGGRSLFEDAKALKELYG